MREPKWPLHIGGDKENRADESWQSCQEALLKHMQEVLSFPSCLCKLNLLQVKTSFKICGSALAHVVLAMALCGVLPLTAPLSNLLACEFQGQGCSTESSTLPAQLPAEIQQPLWDYRLHTVADQTRKELSPHCSPSPSSPGPLSGNEKQPKLDNPHNHSTTGQQGYCPNRTQCQQLPWQDTLRSTGQLDLRRMDNPMVCLKRYRRHRLNINQKEKSTDHHHINGLSLAFSAHYCLV